MKDLLILLPGNPSIPGIYDRFIAELQSLMPATDTLVLTHYGQSASDAASRTAVSLDRVIEQHQQDIELILQQKRPRRLILMAHSLGSAVAVSLYPRLSPIVAEIKLVLICPFLGPRGRNQTLLKTLSIKAINRPLQLLIRRLLADERRALKLMERHLNLGSSQDQVYQVLRSEHYLHNFVSLVSDYIRYFEGRDLHRQLDRLPPADALFILAHQDFWVPDETIDSLPDGARQLTLDHIEHGFCMHPRQCSHVARASADFLGERVPIRPEP